MVNTEYITNPGDRWDLIAFKAYGTIGNLVLEDGSTVNAMSLIINANPDVSVTDILDSGLLLQVPIVVSTALNNSSDLLPPWKASTGSA